MRADHFSLLLLLVVVVVVLVVFEMDRNQSQEVISIASSCVSSHNSVVILGTQLCVEVDNDDWRLPTPSSSEDESDESSVQAESLISPIHVQRFDDINPDLIDTPSDLEKDSWVALIRKRAGRKKGWHHKEEQR